MKICPPSHDCDRDRQVTSHEYAWGVAKAKAMRRWISGRCACNKPRNTIFRKGMPNHCRTFPLNRHIDEQAEHVVIFWSRARAAQIRRACPARDAQTQSGRCGTTIQVEREGTRPRGWGGPTDGRRRPSSLPGMGLPPPPRP